MSYLEVMLRNSKPYIIKIFIGLLVASFIAVIFFKFGRAENTKLNPPVKKTSATGKFGDFTLLDHEGNIQNLYQHSDAKYVVIISQGNACPIIQKYAGTIRDLKNRYSPTDVSFLMINANRGDERASIIKEAQDYNYGVPILLDPSQIVSDALGLTRTSEAVVISTDDWNVVYRGAIDDRIGFGVDKQTSRNYYLQQALDSLLAGQTIALNGTAAKGCSITYQKSEKISYTHTIAPLLKKKCVTCHSETGGHPPFFKSYESIASWAAMITETLFTDRMPPFSADTFYGKFKKNISLSDSEKSLLVQWLKAGLPNDGPAGAGLLPPKKVSVPLPPVIYKAAMSADVQIPPKGIPEYQYHQLGEALPYDMWIRAIEVSTTNPRQLHHESLLVSVKPLAIFEKINQEIREKDGVHEDEHNRLRIRDAMKISKKESSVKPLAFTTQVWATGRTQPTVFEENTIAFFPKGSYLILETHHMGSGKPETEKTSIKFYGYRAKPPTNPRYFTGKAGTFNVEIPPNVKKHIIFSDPWIAKRSIKILNVRGHLHMRGKAIKLLAEDNNGNRRIIASIPNYYYGWQTGNELVFENPIAIPRGTKLIAHCEYDNSRQNQSNPDSSQKITWGQRHDTTEMCHVTFGFMGNN